LLLLLIAAAQLATDFFQSFSAQGMAEEEDWMKMASDII
jgi:hypothetical protein